MSFPRYPAYKATGMDWLGEVPDHWSVNRLKLAVDSCTNGVWGDEAKSDENDVVCIRVADFDRQSLAASRPDEPTIRNVSDRDIEQRILRNGDLLIEKSGGGEKQPVGAVVLYTGVAPAVCSNFVARMRLKKDQIPSFWKYVHHAAYSVRLNTKSIKQTSGIQNLDQQQYLNEIAAYPPLEEQLSIANFLDHETGKIDDLIAEQERLIDLLQEKRQAVISHAVTKGLNPDAPMKDSGVEWLGKVPEHWEVKALKRLSPKQTVGIVVNPSSYISDEGLPFIYGGDIREEVIDLENCRKISKEDSLSQPKTILEGEDLITVRVGAPGVTAVVPEAAAGGNCASVMLTKKGAFESRWLCYLMNSRPYRHQVEVVQYGAAQEQFNISHAVEFICPTPPIAEQKEIADYLLKECQAIDNLGEQVKMSIVLMQERRSALISAAVTGQIDVRDLVSEQERTA